MNKSEHVKIEMLKAFCYRNSSQGRLMMETYRKIYYQYPNHKFADDALTEIGLYYLLWEYNGGKKAREIFDKVIKEYPNSNAVDNAMNWKAYSYMKERMYNDAFWSYMDLVKKEPFSRFIQYAFNNIIKMVLKTNKDYTFPIVTYLNEAGKLEEVGYANINSKPIIFHVTKNGTINKLKVNFSYSTYISNFNFLEKERFVVFQAEDNEYIVNYAWDLSSKTLYYIANNKRNMKKLYSSNYMNLYLQKVKQFLKTSHR